MYIPAATQISSTLPAPCLAAYSAWCRSSNASAQLEPSPAPPRREGSVGYVLKRYPRLSETFIVNEILGVERAGREVRILAGAIVLFPLGFLMGIMFPWGLVHLEKQAPQLVPWAWAINGTVSVISAAAAAILALGFGFSFVVQVGAAAYAVATLLTRRIPASFIPKHG